MKHLLQATQIQAAKTKQSNTKCRDRQPGIFFYLYDLYELKRLFPRLPQPLLLQASALPTAPPLSVCCRSRRMQIRTVGLNT